MELQLASQNVKTHEMRCFKADDAGEMKEQQNNESSKEKLKPTIQLTEFYCCQSTNCSSDCDSLSYNWGVNADRILSRGLFIWIRIERKEKRLTLVV